MTTENGTTTRTEKATFGAGCFWQVEAAFRELDGVIDTAVGYEGGHVDNPTYEQVCSGTPATSRSARSPSTPRRSSYEELVEKYFEIHDPTQLNRQGPDVGWQYRSVIFAHSDEQAEIARRVIERAQERFRDPIVTEIEPATAVLARRGVPPVLPREARLRERHAGHAARALAAPTSRPGVHGRPFSSTPNGRRRSGRRTVKDASTDYWLAFGPLRREPIPQPPAPRSVIQPGEGSQHLRRGTDQTTSSTAAWSRRGSDGRRPACIRRPRHDPRQGRGREVQPARQEGRLRHHPRLVEREARAIHPHGLRSGTCR